MPEKRTAKPGTVSEGTMRPEDLIPEFERILNVLDHDSWTEWCGYFPTVYDACRRDANEIGIIDQSEVYDSLESLYNRLDECSAKGYYFGAHPGNGSDYGWWEDEDEDGNFDKIY